MSSPIQRQVLGSYLPRTQLRSLAALPDSETATPVVKDAEAAVMVTDISGFTALTERLSRQGPHGAEVLTEVMNACFGAIIDLVYASGGDVLDFEGDALIATWMAGGNTSLRDAARRASHTANLVQEQLDGRDFQPGITLRLRSAVSAGPVRLLSVGGDQGRWRFLVAGRAMAEVGHGSGLASPGELVVAPAAASAIGDDLLEEAPRPDGFLRLRRGLPRAPTVPPGKADVTQLSEQSLRRQVIETVRKRVDAGHHDWLAENRRLTALFINLPTIAGATTEECEALHRIVLAIQSAMDRLEGTFLQLLIGDKGCVALCVFGIPPDSHEDDPSRACRAALQLQDDLSGTDIPFGIGVGTGSGFCGVYGNDRRRQYSVVGDAVNIGARLMQFAAGGVAVDDATARSAKQHVEFERLKRIPVKGRREPVDTWKPLRPRTDAAVRAPSSERMVGRQSERATARRVVASYLEGGTSRNLLIEGEAGIGKSFVLAELLAELKRAGLDPHLGDGRAIEASTPFFAWRPIFARVLRLEGDGDPRARVSAVIGDLAPRFRDLAPLLRAVLPFELPETPATTKMPPQLRAESTRALLIELLRRDARQRRPVFVLDDGHWLDSASWLLLGDVLVELPEAFIAVASRPFEHGPKHVRARLVAHPATTCIALSEMGGDDIAQLVRDRLGVEAVPELVDRLVLERSGGHPLFAEELAISLRESGAIRVDQGRCELVREGVSAQQLALPETVQAAITARLDRLAPQHQLAAKVAALVGRSFEVAIVDAIYPVDDDRRVLRTLFEHLEHSQFTHLDAPEPNLRYLFKHVIVQQVAYGLLSFSQRRQLHARTAERLESGLREAGEANYPLLAHHLLHAEEYRRCVDYLEKAGDSALGNGANEEAIRFFQRALDISGAHDRAMAGAVDDFRRARWHRQMGEAYNVLGDIRAGTDHFQRALTLLGISFAPDAQGRWTTRLLREGATQLAHLVLPTGLWQRKRNPAVAGRAMAARMLGIMSEHYYYDLDIAGWFTASLASINLAEKAGDATAGARAYGGLGYLVGVMRLRPLALRYTALGRRGTDVRAAANAYYGEGLIYYGFGDWDRCLACTRRGLELARRSGDIYSQGVGMICEALALDYSGKTLESLAVAQANISNARSLQNPLHRTWALVDSAFTLANIDRLDDALGHLEEAEELLDKADHASVVRFHGTYATVLGRVGRRSEARPHAKKSLELHREGTPATFFLLQPLHGVAEFFLDAWEAGEASARSDAEEMIGAVTKYCQSFPVGAPKLELLKGRLAAVSGLTKRARRHFEKAIAVARRVNTPQDIGLAELRLAGLIPETEGNLELRQRRAAHLRRARACFERHGLLWYLR